MVKRTALRAAGTGVALGATVIGLAACGGSSSSSFSTGAAGAAFPLTGMASGSGSAGMGSSMSGKRTSRLNPAYGVADLTQQGDHLTGFVSVWGLAPNSRHAEHLLGPDGACSPSSRHTMNMAVVLPDLTANAGGVAYTRFDLRVHQKVVAVGYYITVRRDPTPAGERGDIVSAPASPAFKRSIAHNPMVLCGRVEVR